MLTVFTIGHSSYSVQKFITMCIRAGIDTVVDIRSSPTSKANPQYYRAEMEVWLEAAGIEYICEKEDLGGHRGKQVKLSPNTALWSTSFSYYADYMLVHPEFIAGRERVLALAASGRNVAIMCAEYRPYAVKDRMIFSCHRMMVSDNLAAICGAEVLHVDGNGQTFPHVVTPIARVAEVNGQKHLLYDDGQPPLVYDLTIHVPKPRKSRKTV